MKKKASQTALAPEKNFEAFADNAAFADLVRDRDACISLARVIDEALYEDRGIKEFYPVDGVLGSKSALVVRKLMAALRAYHLGENDPECAADEYMIGLEYEDLQQFDQAERHLRRAIELRKHGPATMEHASSLEVMEKTLEKMLAAT